MPRITHTAHQFEITASAYYGPQMQAICAAAPGALASVWVPVATLAETGGPVGNAAAGPASTAHIMGTARMGNDPTASVVDACGRMHDVDNVYVGDGSVFTSAGGFNPTITIMALSLRMARHITGCGPVLEGEGGLVDEHAEAVDRGGTLLTRRGHERRDRGGVHEVDHELAGVQEIGVEWHTGIAGHADRRGVHDQVASPTVGAAPCAPRRAPGRPPWRGARACGSPPPLRPPPRRPAPAPRPGRRRPRR